MNRDITEVIDRILDAIPEESLYEDVIGEIKDIRESAIYTAPEGMRDRWVQLCLALQDLGQPNTAWKLKVEAIITGRE